MKTLLHGRRSATESVSPVLIIGISGATWTVIHPMISEGALPSLQRLMREGAWGVLESVKAENDRHFRPQTAWPSILTGRLPANHGITEYFHTFRNMRSQGVWDVFNAKGLPVGLYSTPVFWPPPRVDGFVVPAPHGRDDKAWPEEISFIMEYYRHHQDSKLRTNAVRTMLKSLRFVPLLLGSGQDRRLAVRLLRSALRILLERDPQVRALLLRNAKLDFSTAVFVSLCLRYQPAFAIFTSFEVDYVSHRYWRYHEAGRFPDSLEEASPVLRRAVKDAYAHMDESIGLLLERLPPDCIVAVISEHGMAAEIRSNEIGRWQYMIDGSRIQSLAGLGDDMLPVPIARWIAFRRRDGGPVDGSVEGRLRGLTVVETGLPLFKTHFHAPDEVVIKLNVHRGDYPDSDDIGRLNVRIPGRGTMPLARVLQKVGPARSAMHAKEGVFILRGRGVRSGIEVKGAAVTDVMPTLLRASGLDVPGGLDGHVLDVFA